MIRIKDKLYQVVVGDDMERPLDCTITSVFLYKNMTKGKVLLNGKKRPVKLLGGGVWILTDGSSTLSPKQKAA